VILDASTVGFIDVTAVQMLDELVDQLRSEQVTLLVARDIGVVRDVLRRASTVQGLQRVYPSVQDAIRAVQEAAEKSPLRGDARSPPAVESSWSIVDASYEIRIKGRVGPSVLESFEDMESAIRPAETVLRGTVADQAQLHGLLERIQLLGLELIEIRQVPGGPGSEPGHS
jgi:hypothetical protein